MGIFNNLCRGAGKSVTKVIKKKEKKQSYTHVDSAHLLKHFTFYFIQLSPFQADLLHF